MTQQQTTQKLKINYGEISAHGRKILTENGDNVIFELVINSELITLLKECCVIDGSLMDVRITTLDRYNPETKKRYKIKAIYNKGLDFGEYLFIKEFLDNGIYQFNFSDITDLIRFRNVIENDINSLIRNYTELQTETTTIFRVNTN